MKQPTVFGRKLPPNDWEGDDLVYSGGRFVTCTDTSLGRMAYWATNGQVNLDGKQIRAAVYPRDPDGITLAQGAQALHHLTGLEVVIDYGWSSAEVKTHLRYGRGLCIAGWYRAIPREYREQFRADFTHRMWVSHRSEATGNVRTWDPLNPRHEYGRWLPWDVIWDFIMSWGSHAEIGYVPLGAL